MVVMSDAVKAGLEPKQVGTWFVVTSTMQANVLATLTEVHSAWRNLGHSYCCGQRRTLIESKVQVGESAELRLDDKAGYICREC